MGVVDGNGVVGIVYEIFFYYFWVILVLNSKFSISCKIVGSEYFGYLKWEYGDVWYVYLKDLFCYVEFNLGDIVVISGYFMVFFEGIMIGMVDDMVDLNDGFFYLLKVKLVMDFGKVSEVCVIVRIGQRE